MMRDEAIEVLRANYPDACFEQLREAVDIAIEALSEPKIGWIPVSERLPKEKDRVLTYDSIGHIDFGQYDRGLWYWEAEACADYWLRNDGVLAWMPLPEPYREDSEA